MDELGSIFLKRKKNSYKAGYCFVTNISEQCETDDSFFHPTEKYYYENLAYAKRKCSYLLGRKAAKKAAKVVVGDDITIQSFAILYGVFQFPVVKYMENRSIQVTISHIDDFGVAVAFPEEHPIGVDLEKIEIDKMESINSFITKEELKSIQSNGLTQITGGFTFWTVKESLSKILKTGLMVDHKIFEIESFVKKDDSFISTFKYFSQYKGISKQIENYVCSIVLPKNTSCNLNGFWNIFAKIVKNVNEN